METINETLLRREKERERIYKQELKKQIRSWETYFDQLANILTGVIRITGWWLLCTVFLTASALLFWFMCDDFTVYPYAEIKKMVRFILILSGSVSVMACFLTNTGRFKNIFIEYAKNYASRNLEFQKKVELVESVLIRHALINESDVKERLYEDSTKSRVRDIEPK